MPGANVSQAHSLEQLNAEPVIHTLADGTEYKLSPIGPADVAAFESYVRQCRYKLHCETLEHLDFETAQKMARTILWGVIPPDVLDDEAKTPEGARFIVWRSIKKKHPRVKLEDLASCSEQDLEAMAVAIALLSGRDTENPTGEPVQPGTP